MLLSKLINFIKSTMVRRQSSFSAACEASLSKIAETSIDGAELGGGAPCPGAELGWTIGEAGCAAAGGGVAKVDTTLEA
jgi:hypothetical protein